jgi:hypothetical protein
MKGWSMNFLDNLIADFKLALINTPLLIRSLIGKSRGRRLARANYPDSTVEDYCDILFIKSGAFPIYGFLYKIVTALEPVFKVSDAEYLQKGLDATTLQESTKNNRKKVIRIFLRYLVHIGIVKEESDAIDSIVQYQVVQNPKAVLTPQQRKIIDNGTWSPVPFIDIRNKVTYKLLRRHGDRPEIEINRINRDRIDTRLWIVTIEGKGGIVRHHRLFCDEIELMERYIYERDRRVASLPGYADEDAFIIRNHPKMYGRAENAIPTWRLDLPGIYAIYSRMRQRNPILQGTNPYSCRHTRISHAHIICSILGIPLEYASKAFGNSITTRMKYYDHGYDLVEEIVTCDFDTELLPLYHELIRYCDMKLMENSTDQMYLLVKRRIEERMGEVGLLKVMAGRSPGLRQFYQSDSQDDFYALWEKDRTKGFLNPPQIVTVNTIIIFGFENCPF